MWFVADYCCMTRSSCGVLKLGKRVLTEGAAGSLAALHLALPGPGRLVGVTVSGHRGVCRWDKVGDAQA